MIETLQTAQRPPFAQPVDIAEIAQRYVTNQLGAGFSISRPKLRSTEKLWWALVQYQATGQSRPIGVGQICVDAQTGEVLPIRCNELQAMQEKAAVLAAKQHGVLPVNEQGYVLGEYARKQADRYLWDHLGMYYRACDPVFTPGEPPLWQVTIHFKMYDLGPFRLGVMTVDAKSGMPFPLTEQVITKIKERVHAITGHQTSPANPG